MSVHVAGRLQPGTVAKVSFAGRCLALLLAGCVLATQAACGASRSDDQTVLRGRPTIEDAAVIDGEIGVVFRTAPGGVSRVAEAQLRTRGSKFELNLVLAGAYKGEIPASEALGCALLTPSDHVAHRPVTKWDGSAFASPEPTVTEYVHDHQSECIAGRIQVEGS